MSYSKKEKQGFWFRGEKKLYLNTTVSYLERGEGNFSLCIKKTVSSGKDAYFSLSAYMARI
jgi:hypothetical protein